MTETTEPSGPTPDEIDEYEICPTPAELALAICKRVWESSVLPEGNTPLRILEPSAGEGAFVAAARATWPEAFIAAIEIRPECENALRAAGANDVTIAGLEDCDPISEGTGAASFDLVIGNPPFSHAEEHIRLLLAAMKPGAVLAFLLKMSFYESHKRVDFWREFPEDSFAPLVPRPGFKLNGKGKRGTDSQAYALFTWAKRESCGSALDGRALPIRADHIVWREEQKKRGRGRPRGSRNKPVPSSTVLVEGEAIDLE